MLVTTFSSNIHRIQQFLDAAERCGRKALIAGRSMQRNVRVARELGYLSCPDSIFIGMDEMDEYADADLAILASGSQGEPMSALTQMSRDRHRIRIRKGDTVIRSSTAIPGNEEQVWHTVNRLIRRGARVVYDLITPVHASGHAMQEELKLVYGLLRPLYVVPFHGEPRMMQAYTEMLQAMGVPRDTVVWLENGDRLGLDGIAAEKLEPIANVGPVFVDGLSEEGVSDVVLRDRRHLAEGGTVIVTLTRDEATAEILSGPEFIARGFAQPEYADELFEEVAPLVLQALRDQSAGDDIEREEPAAVVRETVARFLRRKTGRRPVVVPIIVEM